jgi:hypothetical protein
VQWTSIAAPTAEAPARLGRSFSFLSLYLQRGTFSGVPTTGLRPSSCCTIQRAGRVGGDVGLSWSQQKPVVRPGPCFVTLPRDAAPRPAHGLPYLVGPYPMRPGPRPFSLGNITPEPGANGLC